MSLVLRRLTRMRLGVRVPVQQGISRGISTIRAEMEAKFTEHGVIPDVIDIAPKDIAKVEWSAPEQCSADFGNVLTPTKVQNAPAVTWPAEDGALYTLIKTDPDAPSRTDPKWREWHHWLVVNIPNNDIAKGEDMSQYIGAGPPKDTGLHRYVFLIYKQPSKLTCDEKRLTNTSGDGRGGWNTRAFVNKYKLGNPVAGNFYQAEHDDYVPILYKKLGF